MSNTALFAGRYQMLRRLGEGGMGDVWLAEQSGPRGFRRYAVIKRVRSHLADDPRLIASFIDEAKLAAVLQHPNIARIEDFGESNGSLFLVLEYVDGVTVRDLAQFGEGSGAGIPTPLIVHLVAQTARALFYAHNVRDLDGNELKIVHRDVTPHNIMVTPDGQAKLLDFGVASSATQGEETQVGVIKGKIPYLSPEQAHLLPLDGRSDLFSLGTVLWELLARQRLFLPGPQLDIVRRIRAGTIPDVPFKTDCPPELKDLVLRALAVDLEQRIPDGRVFASELERIAQAHFTPPTTETCREWIESLTSASRSPLPVRSAQHKLIGATGAFAIRRASQAVYEEKTVVDDATPFGVDDSSSSQGFTASIGHPQNNLPRHMTRFIGREAEVQRMHTVLSGEAQLLSLCGPGGMGKSRLAVHYASRFLHSYAGGAWFIDLSSATDLQDILATTCAALNVPIVDNDEGKPIDRVGSVIAGRGNVLLIFDNFEQVTKHAAECFTNWLRVAPLARFVVTTQQQLGLRAETILELAPLSSVNGYDLFVATAEKLSGAFGDLSEEEAAIHAIVETLDGLPLAIELAAAKTSVLTPSQILDRLDKRFKLLRTTSQDWSERQRTLYNTIDWSWGLLEPWEQHAFVQCTAFRGGFFIEDAENVIDLSDYPDAPMIIEVLERLRKRSLLRTWILPELRKRVRFGMYDSIHAFAVARRRERPNEDDLLDRHSRQMLERAETLLDDILGENALQNLTILGHEIDNICAITERKNRHYAVKAATLAARVMIRRGPYEQLRHYTDQAIAEGRRENMSEEVAEALLIACATQLQRGAIEDCDASLAEGLAISEALNSDKLAAQFKRLHADLSFRRGDFEEAKSHLADALQRARHAGHVETELMATYTRAVVETMSGHLDEGERFINQYVALARHHGVVTIEAKAQAVMGWLLRRQGRLVEAEQCYRDALEQAERYDDLYVAGAVATNLGALLSQRGNFEDALHMLNKALDSSRRLGRRNMAGFSRINLAVLAMQQNDVAQAKSWLRKSEETVDDRLAAWSSALLSLVEGLDGDTDRASQLSQTALARAEACGDPLAIILAKTCHSGVELGLAAKALAAGDTKTSRHHLERVEALIVLAQAPLNTTSSEAQPSAAEQDADIAVALTLIETTRTRLQETLATLPR